MLLEFLQNRREKREREPELECLSFPFSSRSEPNIVHFLSFFLSFFLFFSMVDGDTNAAAAASASQRVVVLDNGGCTIKLGFAGDAQPM